MGLNVMPDENVEKGDSVFEDLTDVKSCRKKYRTELIGL